MTNPAAPQITPRLLCETLAAAYLGRSKTCFRQDVAKGRLPQPSDRNGRRRLWDIRILDKHVDGLSGLAASSNSWDDI